MTHGVLAVVGLQLQHVALAVDEDGVVVVGHPLQPELGAWRGRHTAPCRIFGNLAEGYIITPVTEAQAKCLDLASTRLLPEPRPCQPSRGLALPATPCPAPSVGGIPLSGCSQR
jgi:hypothetical protein